MAPNLQSDSPLCRRIVLSFLDFLNLVQPGPGVDFEGLAVVRDCLTEVFKLDPSSSNDGMQSGVLINLFSSWEAGEQCKSKSVLGFTATENSSTSQQSEDFSYSKTSNATYQVGPPNVEGENSKDELFGKFYAALDSINFFTTTSDGVENPAQIAKATQFFNDALKVMESSEGQIINLSNLAEAFKLRGNQSMQSKLYSEAIDLYTCAIALCERNAVYCCNRAAAFTQARRYREAFEDCLKSIDIDPCYSKAYSRLGLLYYDQGNYSEAIKEGFLKALQLDPNNDSIKENIRVSQQKLIEQHQRAGTDQNSRSNRGQESATQAAWSTNPNIPFAPFSPPFPPIPPPPSPGVFPPMNGGFMPSPTNAAIPPDLPNMLWAATQLGGSQGNNTSFASFPFNPSAVSAFANMFRPTTQSGGSTNNSSPFGSFPFDPSTPEYANLFRNMPSAPEGEQAHDRRPSGNSGRPSDPGIRVNANVSMNFAEAPELFSDAVRSPQQEPQQGNPRGPMPD